MPKIKNGNIKRRFEARQKKKAAEEAVFAEKRQKILLSYKLTDLDRELIRLLVDYPDITSEELAELLGVEQLKASQMRNKPAVKKALIELFEENKDVLVRVQKQALFRLMKLVNSDNDNIALRAVQTALMPMLNEYKIKAETKDIKEIIFRSKIGSKGQLMQDVEKIEDDKTVAHKNTLDLLAGSK